MNRGYLGELLFAEGQDTSCRLASIRRMREELELKTWKEKNSMKREFAKFELALVDEASDALIEKLRNEQSKEPTFEELEKAGQMPLVME